MPVVGTSEELNPTTIVASILSDVLESISSTQGEPKRFNESVALDVVAPGHIEKTVVEDAPAQGEQTTRVQNDVPMVDAPAEGEILGEKEGQSQRERTEKSLVNDFQGVTTSSSNSDCQDAHDDLEEPVARVSKKGKEVASEIPLLEEAPFQRPQRQRFAINLKPVIERLDAQGEILCSVQSDVNSIFMSQASTVKEMGMVKNAIRWLNKEMGSMKTLLSDILKEVRASTPPAPTQPAPQPSEDANEEIATPSRPVSAEESGPSGPSIPDEAVKSVPSGHLSEDPAGPSGPVLFDQVTAEESGPRGPAEDLPGPTGLVVPEADHVRAEEEEAVAPEPPAPSPIQTPAPPSPPPAPPTFKQPLPRNISSPTPFPSQSSSSPVSTTHIPVPPASLSGGASSSSGPSSFGPTDIPHSTSHSFLHPTTPPSFITIIPESAQIDAPFLRDIKDEFEEAILRSVLKILHKDTWVSFIQKEIKMIRYFQMFNDYRYLHRLPEILVGQFQQTISALGLVEAHTEAIQGHVNADVIAPLLSECERLSPSEWVRFYPLSAQQLTDLNVSQAREAM
ncbi:hypothetical protein Taro_009470 [Colocasia esculenta]|uniref:Uncharacterized protein n=1 Tax=Colocasia esculenta TaxID=4460 RepID=A0A843U4V2_COLES|nr:hypothetical protein [Colocasia esculenta]